MICYKDKTFCKFYEQCRHGTTCPDALTDKVKEDAVKWWGDKDTAPPIAMYMEPPGRCYEAKDQTEHGY